MKVYLLLIALLNLSFAGIVYSENSDQRLAVNVFRFSNISAETICSEAEKNLLLDNLNKKIYFPYFLSTEIITKHDSCIRFINKINADNEAKYTDFTISKITPEQAEAFSITEPFDTYVFADRSFHELCIEQGYCKDLLPELSFIQRLKLCNPRFGVKKYIDYLKPKLRKAEFKIIRKLNLINGKDIPFTEYIENIIRSSEDDTIFLSSMNLGNFSGAKLNKLIQEKSKTVFLAADAKVLFSQTEHALIQSVLKNPGFNILPMLSNNEFSGFHHWKICTDSKSAISAITSMNISNPDKINFSDYIYEFDDNEIADQLRFVLITAMQKQCDSIEDIMCYLDYVFDDIDLKNNWQRLIERSCMNFTKRKFAFNGSGKYLINSSDSNLVKLVVDFINNAKNEIAVVSHQINHSDIIKALKSAKLRGVKTKIYSNEKILAIGNFKFDILINSKSFAYYDTVLMPHMKLIISDNNKMLFGTANFTLNALENSRELMAVTEDLSSIEKVKSYLSYLEFKAVD